MSTATSPPPGSPFALTRWTLVLRAQGATPEARAALSDLCAAYYDPVLQFIRREGRVEDSARELTQEFFSRLLERGALGGADPAQGRFRSYLLGAVKHFLADERKRLSREKRGGGFAPDSLDAPLEPDAPPRDIPDERALPADATFDRHWALTLMDRALQAVDAELTAAGKGEQFRVLKPWLAGDAQTLSQAEAARQLGLSEGAVKVAIHRLRKRFREQVRTELSHTVGQADQLDDELRYLIEVLTRG